ncbi:S-protein homolog 2-like [Punica granatum]|uniref:S-protein homolog 2-like n=2 Tax=Punica granatum TaxID=22663 RepID=A0A6P8BV59_PUNGR|nr:S-protein homolog 2-like [Punica granatum]PKI36641.1 hypothetical protein CRG98_042967 [Punica granatum]
MTSMSRSTLFVIYLIGFWVRIITANARSSVAPKKVVEIYNKLPFGMVLDIHCKSKNRDLGNHTIFGPQFYQFQVRPSRSGTTEYSCEFNWVGVAGALVNDFYTEKRDTIRCATRCRWVIRYEGIYGYREDTGEPDIVYEWQTSPPPLHLDGE